MLDVRHESERTDGWIEGSVLIPIHQPHRRIGEVPVGTVRVHCAGGTRAGITAPLPDAAGRHVAAADVGSGAAIEAGPAIVTGC